MNNKKKVAIGFISIAVVGMVASGALYKFGYLNIGNNALKNAEYVSSSNLAATVQGKYAEENVYGYDYGEPIKDVPRDYVMNLELGFDLSTIKFENWTELFGFYTNPDLTGEYIPIYEVSGENKNKLTINPPRNPKAAIFTSNLESDFVQRYQHTDTTFFERDACKDWGNVGKLYMATYIDLETGKKLDKPIVKVITFKGEITQSPKLSYKIEENGLITFQWDKVEGAEEYVIGRVENSELDSMDSLFGLGATQETSWTSEAPKYKDNSMNMDFRAYDVCEDAWYDEATAQRTKEIYGVESGVVPNEHAQNTEFCVIAINKDGTSMISNRIKLSDLASNLPESLAINLADKTGEKSVLDRYDSVEKLPLYEYVTMCDGYTVKKLNIYDIENAKVVNRAYPIVDDETGEIIENKNIDVLEIPYHVSGTPFEFFVEILEYDKVNFEKDLQVLQARQDELQKKSGEVKVDSDIEIKEGAKENEQVRQVENAKITANSALSEYLATNMLGTASTIDLSEFPESSDQDLLEDAWMEAYYQNPAILGIKGYRLSQDGKTMKMVYDDDVETTASKQEEIFQKVQEVTASIIKSDMTDLQKELAINQYLCDTIEYDEAALKNAEENDFKSVDKEFNDSFTAYGALINGKCVCAGYSAAFKLLADAAGLESIVVTGLLDGNLSHAWNKVSIDGKWEIIDTTNNDNEYMTNALLNLPNYAGDRVLVEDEDFAIDNYLTNYEANETESEYYRISSKYFDSQKIAEQLAIELKEKGTSTLRTDYELNDDQFNEIVSQVYQIMGEDTELYGYHWMGVIYLTTSM